MRTHPITASFVFFLLVLVSWLMPRYALAIGQEVCNETSYIIYMATGIPEGKHTRTEGWVRLRPGQCRVVMPAPFSDKPYYAYGHSSEVHAGGRQQWGGARALCVDDTGNFSLDGKDDCAALGLRTHNFNVIDVHPPNGGRTVLAEPAGYGKRAELAGIQRLLSDNGYPMRTIDGYDGRRTRSAIRKFLVSRKIKSRPEPGGLIDALETAARENLVKTGLRVCNKTPLPVWTAYGRRKGRSWESRGWWKIAPRACTALLSGLVKDKSIYLYAGIMERDTERPLLMADENYCVSEILFAITGKNKCALRGYEERPFRRYKNESGKGMTINLAPEDFAKVDVLAGLRR
ncbi:MAG: hypothetical protein COA85_10480 [Robiginitomaculum sp.]|nr:MAG: hypothetical protein COA85_10480 [Robiginitomaculum sp.]